MNIEVNGKKIHYLQEGRGEPIIFVHGWGGTIASLNGLHKRASQKFNSYSVDLPGFGESDNPDPEWGVEEYASLLHSLIEKLGYQQINYFGHSFGGSLGIWLAVHHKKMIKKLILCNSSFKRKPQPAQSTKKLKSFGRNIPGFSALEPFLKRACYRIFYPQSDLIKYPHLESNFRKIMTEDLSPIISHIDVPSLILWGEQDTYTPVELAHILHKDIKGSVMKIYPEAKHGLPLKYPDLIWPEIEKFINQ